MQASKAEEAAASRMRDWIKQEDVRLLEKHQRLIAMVKNFFEMRAYRLAAEE